jgi:hypothetical protein
VNDTAITPTQELLLEVLAARYRCGEQIWTFSKRFSGPLDDLASKGYVYAMHGVVGGTVRAGLTSDGKERVLFADYIPGGRTLWNDGSHVENVKRMLLVGQDLAMGRPRNESAFEGWEEAFRSLAVIDLVMRSVDEKAIP